MSLCIHIYVSIYIEASTHLYAYVRACNKVKTITSGPELPRSLPHLPLQQTEYLETSLSEVVASKAQSFRMSEHLGPGSSGPWGM